MADADYKLVPPSDDATRIYNDDPVPDGPFPEGGPFAMPTRPFTLPPRVISGAALVGEGTLWIIVSPAWRCAAMGKWAGIPGVTPTTEKAKKGEEYICPVFDACMNHGPRCDGRLGSGWISNLTPSLTNIPKQTTGGGSMGYGPQPSYDPETGAFYGIYQTQYPYQPGTLSLSFQGTALIKDTQFVELDPTQGTFQIIQLIPVEESGELYVEYQSYGAETAPLPGTIPTYPPGEGGYPDVPDLGPGRTYRPQNQRQSGWGTIYDSTNCNMACSAMALDRHTLGRNTRYVGSPQSVPPSHRYYSGETSLKGTGHDDAKRAWTNGWGQSLTVPGATSWSYFVHQIQSGRGGTIFGRYAYMAQPYKKSRTFNGPHAVYINEQLSDGSFWGYDPIVGYPIVYPYNVLRTYADSYYGFRDRVTAAFTRITPRMP